MIAIANHLSNILIFYRSYGNSNKHSIVNKFGIVNIIYRLKNIQGQCTVYPEEAKKNILLLLHNIGLSKRVLFNFSKDSCNNGY